LKGLFKMEKLKPKLRFREFEDEWINKKLGDILNITSASRVHKNEWTESGIRFFRSSDVVSHFKGNDNTKAFISQDLYESLSSKIGRVKKNDILITGGGSIGIPYLIEDDEPLYFKDADLLWIKNVDAIDGHFLYSYFLTESFKEYLNNISHIGTIAHYTVNQAKNTPFNFPSLPEQQKIALFLSTVYEKIQLLKKEQSLLEKYKKGLMQKIFSRELRFKDANGGDFQEWEEKKLKEVITKQSSNISANSIESNVGEYIIYGAAGELKKVDFYEIETDYISIVKDGAGVGRLLFCKGKSSVLGTLEILSPLNSNIDTRFAYYLLLSIDFSKYVTGSTIPHIYFRDYQHEKIEIPVIQEQQKIASFLSTIDEKIDKVKDQISLAEEWKKGLLQQMFV
jgi:type I restriction enzyme S subunit